MSEIVNLLFELVNLVVEKHGYVIRRAYYLLITIELALECLDEALLSLNGPSEFYYFLFVGL